MDKGINNLIKKEYNYKNKKANYYDSAELDYHEWDIFN